MEPNAAISDYLSDHNKVLKTGKCKVCDKTVQWRQNKLASHKRASCIGVSDEEKRKFLKRSFVESGADNSNSSIGDASNISFEALGTEKRTQIDNQLAKFFYRTGVSFRILDSGVFRELVTSLNPEYAKQMPKSRSLSGRLLDEQYSIAHGKLRSILDENKNLSLVTDGWTNVNGHHIVNFVVKAPGSPSVFYKSLDTTGVRQGSTEIAGDIAAIIRELGEHKFVSLLTDNAPVMKASWEEVEEMFPRITAAGCSAHVTNLLVQDILKMASNPGGKKEIVL